MSKLSSVACRGPWVQLVFSPCCLVVYLGNPLLGSNSYRYFVSTQSLPGWRDGKTERGNPMLCEQAPYFLFSPHTAKQVSSNAAVTLNKYLLIDLWNVIGDLSGVTGHFSEECLGQGNLRPQECGQISSRNMCLQG